MLKLLLITIYSFYSFTAYCNSSTPLEVYDSVVEITTNNFYDQTYRGLNWKEITEKYRQRLSNYSSEAELQKVINELLSNLNASHTKFITKNDQEYHGLQSIFSFKINGNQFYQCGGWYQNINGRWFVKNIFHNSPLEKSGITRGDEIISVNGSQFTEVDSCNTSNPILIKYRHQQYGPELLVEIRPEKKSAQELLLASTNHSKKIILIGNKRVGYFHLWSGTHDRFLKSLHQAAMDMENTTDVLILDLRDGFGGAWSDYIQPFFNKDLETGEAVKQIYSKPVYVLINEGVRSGKEYLAFLFKKEKRATLIGTNTAGHFLGGALFNIVKGKYALYLAVRNDFTGVLEGKGVAPDIQVTSYYPYSEGKDIQLEVAKKLIQTTK